MERGGGQASSSQAGPYWQALHAAPPVVTAVLTLANISQTLICIHSLI